MAQDLVDAYVRAGATAASRETRQQTLDAFIDWSRGRAGRRSVLELRESDILAYREFLENKTNEAWGFENQVGLANATIATHLATITEFYRLVIRAGLRPDNPALFVPRPERPEPQAATTLSIDHCRRLLEAAHQRGPRSYTILCLLLLYGQPIAQVPELDVGDVQLAVDGPGGATLQALTYRGGRTTVELVSPTREAIAEYLLERAATGQRTDGPLILPPPPDGRGGRPRRERPPGREDRVHRKSLRHELGWIAHDAGLGPAPTRRAGRGTDDAQDGAFGAPVTARMIHYTFLGIARHLAHLPRAAVQSYTGHDSRTMDAVDRAADTPVPVAVTDAVLGHPAPPSATTVNDLIAAYEERIADLASALHERGDAADVLERDDERARAMNALRRAAREGEGAAS